VEKRDGIRVINLRIGIPDREAPSEIKQLMAEYVLEERSTFGYPCDVHPERGIPELIDAIIRHYDEKHGVTLVPENIAVTSWTKDALHNLARLYSPGVAVIPEPIYPAYEAAALLAGHKLRRVPTSGGSKWLPEMRFNGDDTFFFFCDPNNPTDSVADEAFYHELFDEVKKRDVGAIFDKAYKDYKLDEGAKPVSITQIPELMGYGYEVVSLSKHYNFVGIGLGWIVSIKENIDRWLKLSSQFSQGVAWYVQKVGVEALTNPKVQKEMKEYMKELRERGGILVKGLNNLGFTCGTSKATPYVFAQIPEGFDGDDEHFALNVLLEKAHVATMPGSYFGKSGRGYVRFTLFAKIPDIKEGLRRIKDVRDW